MATPEWTTITPILFVLDKPIAKDAKRTTSFAIGLSKTNKSLFKRIVHACLALTKINYYIRFFQQSRVF